MPQRSRELEAGSLVSTSADGICSGNVNMIPSAKSSSGRNSECLSMVISELSRKLIRQKLMLLSDRLLARLSVLPAINSVLPMKGIYSRASYEPCAFLSPDGCSWSRSQQSFPWMEVERSENTSVGWPRSGLISSGTAYPLAPLVRLTNETESGLLPTPSHSDGRRYYVASKASAESRTKVGHQLHWIHAALLSKEWKKGWANPQFSGAMMGFPLNWRLPLMGMRSSRKYRTSLVRPSTKLKATK